MKKKLVLKTILSFNVRVGCVGGGRGSGVDGEYAEGALKKLKCEANMAEMGIPRPEAAKKGDNRNHGR